MCERSSWSQVRHVSVVHRRSATDGVNRLRNEEELDLPGIRIKRIKCKACLRQAGVRQGKPVDRQKMTGSRAQLTDFGLTRVMTTESS